MSICDTCLIHGFSICVILTMAKTPFYTVRQPGLSRLSLQDGPAWRAFCYHDIRAYTLDSDLLILHHSDCIIALRGVNLRQLYLSLLVEEVYEIPLQTAQIPPSECAVTEISIQQISTDD
jgi:hypothetical protein